MRYMYYIWTLNILFYELCPEIGHKIHIPIHYGLHWEKFIGLWTNDKKSTSLWEKLNQKNNWDAIYKKLWTITCKIVTIES